MSDDRDTPSTGWSAPRLIALGNAQASQAGTTPGTVETVTLYGVLVSAS